MPESGEKPLTPKLQATYDFIVERYRERKPMPTVREMARRLNVSLSAAHYRVQELVSLGYLAQRQAYGPMMLVKPPPACPSCGGTGLAE